jgi:hypothetical protein
LQAAPEVNCGQTRRAPQKKKNRWVEFSRLSRVVNADHGTLDVAHGATHFTRNALYREQQNADGSDESASVKVDNTQVQSIPAMGSVGLVPARSSGSSNSRGALMLEVEYSHL